MSRTDPPESLAVRFIAGIVPVVLGQGARLFPDAGPDIALDVLDSRTDSKGVTIQVYRPDGRPQYAT